MAYMKRILPLLALAAMLLAPAAGVLAADPAGGHDHHAVDNRLVPIPPSKETLISAAWVIIIFVVMLAILYPTAWKNVLAGLKKREERIRADIAAAESANARAQAALKEYQSQLSQAESKVRDILAQAGADAEKLATNIKMRSQQEAEEIKERANKEIEASKNAALADIYAQAAELSTSIAEKILRRELKADDQKDLVNRSLEQLQTLNRN